MPGRSRKIRPGKENWRFYVYRLFDLGGTLYIGNGSRAVRRKEPLAPKWWRDEMAAIKRWGTRVYAAKALAAKGPAIMQYGVSREDYRTICRIAREGASALPA